MPSHEQKERARKAYRRTHARADRGVAVYAPDGQLVGRFNLVTRELKLLSSRATTKGAHR